MIAACVVMLAGCAENNGMTRTRAASGSSDGRPFAEAHRECWVVAMNSAGNAQTQAQQRSYDSCMARNGWADQRGIF
jgi:hypothetical protein